MTGKLRYGPRFSSPVESYGYRYSEAAHKAMLPPWQWRKAAPLKRILGRAGAEHKIHPKKVGMPQFSWSEKPMANDNERIEAEQRAIARIEQAVQSIKLSLSELAHTPNPDSKFQNRINQHALIDTLPKLCRCVRPPIELGELEFESAQKPKPVNTHVCINCGVPAEFQYQNEWYCNACIDNVS